MHTFICKEPNIGFHSHLRFGLMGMQTKLRCREKRAPRCYKNIVLYAPTACSLVHFHVVLIKFEKQYFIFSSLSLFWLLSPYNNLYQTFRNIQPSLYSLKERDYSAMRKTFSKKNLKNIRQVFINRFCLLLSYSFKHDVIEGSVARY